MIIQGVTLRNVGFVVDNTIVLNGLAQHLDAKSYSGSGSTWPALVGGNATLYNTPTYTSGTGPYLTFNASSSQYATIPNLGALSNWTIEAWYSTTASISSSITAIVTSVAGAGDTYPINFCLGQGRATLNYNLAAGFWNKSSWQNAAGFMPTVGTWYQSVGTYDGSTITQYTNGSSIATQAASSIAYDTTQPIRIASRWDSQVAPTDFFPGKIGVIRIYNRALTSTEVTQNFNATRNKYGI